VILLDSRIDAKLAAFLTEVEDELRDMMGDHAIAKRLSVLVSARLGGDREDIEEAVSMEIKRLMRIGGGTNVVLLGEMEAGQGGY